MSSKQRLFNCLALAAIMLAITSCYREMDLDKYRDDPGRDVLTLNAVECPDSSVALMATATYFFSDKHLERSYVDSLAPQLTVGGKPCGVMTYKADRHLYFAPVRPQEGDVIDIQVAYKGRTVTVTDTVPRRCRIDSVRYLVQSPVHVYNDNDKLITYYISFTDPAGEPNYYFFQFGPPSRLEEPFMGERRFKQEYVFQQLANVVSKYQPQWEPYSPYGLPFTDEGIDGQHHTLVVQEVVDANSAAFTWPSLPRKFQLYAISQSYYRYMLSNLFISGSTSMGNAMIDLGVAEPQAVYTNVQGGTGIMGCYVEDKVSLTVPAR